MLLLYKELGYRYEKMFSRLQNLKDFFFEYILSGDSRNQFILQKTNIRQQYL